MGVCKMKKIILGSLLLVVSLFGESIYATFDVEAKQSANVAFNHGGIVDKIFVDIGSIVKKNDNLAILNNNDVKAMLHIHQTALKYAKKDYDRQVKIKSMIDKAKFDQHENIYENAKAQVIYQKAILNKTILKAPFDAVVISKEIESGNVVSGQQAKTAFKLQSINERKLVLQFDQKYHQNVILTFLVLQFDQKYHQNVKIGDIFNYHIDGDNSTYSGEIIKIYPYADTKTRKIKAEVLTRDIIVGLFGDGYITSQK